MKNKIIALIYVLITTCGIALAQPKTAQAIIKTKIYCDHCKACESCKARIEHELNYTKGIKTFALDVDKELITVTYNPSKTDIKQIREAINKTGYDADDKIADAKYVAKLDECCRKN